MAEVTPVANSAGEGSAVRLIEIILACGVSEAALIEGQRGPWRNRRKTHLDLLWSVG